MLPPTASHIPTESAGMESLIKITDPKGVIAAVPYLVGQPPQCGVVALVCKDNLVKLGLARDLGEDPPVMATDAMRLVAMAEDEGDALVLIAYGPGPRVTPSMDAILRQVESSRLRLMEALRVHGDRFWSYTCKESCCPIEGTPIDSNRSAIPAEMVAHGVLPLPSLPEQIAQARRSLQPRPLPEEQAKAILEETLATVSRWADPLARAAGQVTRAVDSEKAGQGPQEPDDLLRLAVFVGSAPVRDRVWEVIDTENAHVHIALWTRVARIAPQVLRAAPASLVGAAAWAAKEGPLAQAALEEALEADPDYNMARLIQQALVLGVPVERWLAWLKQRG